MQTFQLGKTIIQYNEFFGLFQMARNEEVLQFDKVPVETLTELCNPGLYPSYFPYKEFETFLGYYIRKAEEKESVSETDTIKNTLKTYIQEGTKFNGRVVFHQTTGNVLTIIETPTLWKLITNKEQFNGEFSTLDLLVDYLIQMEQDNKNNWLDAAKKALQDQLNKTSEDEFGYKCLTHNGHTYAKIRIGIVYSVVRSAINDPASIVQFDTEDEALEYIVKRWW